MHAIPGRSSTVPSHPSPPFDKPTNVTRQPSGVRRKAPNWAAAPCRRPLPRAARLEARDIHASVAGVGRHVLDLERVLCVGRGLVGDCIARDEQRACHRHRRRCVGRLICKEGGGRLWQRRGRAELRGRVRSSRFCWPAACLRPCRRLELVGVAGGLGQLSQRVRASSAQRLPQQNAGHTRTRSTGT